MWRTSSSVHNGGWKSRRPMVEGTCRYAVRPVTGYVEREERKIEQHNAQN